MKTKSITMVASVMALACFGVPSAKAIFGAGDTVIICGDIMDEFKWARELQQWTTQINKITEQVQKADQMIKIVGDPRRLGGELTGLLGNTGALDGADSAAGLETSGAALEFGKSLYGLAAVGRRTVSDFNRVDDNYKVFGESIQRDPKRYEQFSMQQALQVRFETAVKNKEAVERTELALQRQVLEQMKDPNMTQNGRIAGQSALSASKARLDLAALKVQQAKDEYDMFNGRLKMEADRKAVATTEENSAMLASLRQKALDSLRSQGGGAQ